MAGLEWAAPPLPFFACAPACLLSRLLTFASVAQVMLLRQLGERLTAGFKARTVGGKANFKGNAIKNASEVSFVLGFWGFGFVWSVHQ